MKNKVLAVLGIVAVLAVGNFALAKSDANAKALMAKSDCVVAHANAQHYAGDPYSEQAWNLFGPGCD